MLHQWQSHPITIVFQLSEVTQTAVDWPSQEQLNMTIHSRTVLLYVCYSIMVVVIQLSYLLAWIDTLTGNGMARTKSRGDVSDAEIEYWKPVRLHA